MAVTSTGERLDTSVFHDSTIEHLHRYAIARDLVKGKTVLDIACGEGYGSNLLAETARFVHGVDIDDSVVKDASAKYKRNNLQFTAASAEKIPFDTGSFDTVVSFETIEHVSFHETMIAEIKRVLKPNGILLISTPDKKNYSDIPNYNNPFHKKELYREEFIELIRKNFRYHTFYSQNLFIASILFNTEDRSLALFSGDFNQVQQLQDIEPLYVLSICSDHELPAIPSSLFTGKGTVETALMQKEKALKKTASYRLGHFLLWPAKWLRKIFFKKTTLS